MKDSWRPWRAIRCTDTLFQSACTLSLILSAGCAQKAPEANVPALPVVRVIEAGEVNVMEYEYFTGRTDAVEHVELRARVSGYLTGIDFKPGDEVKKGDVLFRIDRRYYEADLARNEGQVHMNKGKLKLAEANIARSKKVAQTPGAISKSDMDAFASAHQEAEGELKSSEASHSLAKLHLEFTEVTSPIDGKIGRNMITLGNLVVQDQTLLATIVAEDPIFAYFDMDERTLLRLQQMVRDGHIQPASEKNQFHVDFGLANEEGKFPHQGVMDFVNNRIDPATGTLQIRCLLRNPPLGPGVPRLLTPGLFLRVRLPVGETHPAIVVPQMAIAIDQGQKYLIVVDPKNTVEFRPVIVGQMQSQKQQIVKPIPIVRDENGVRPAREGEKGEPSIKPGDKVVVGGLQRIKPGMKVEIKLAAPTIAMQK